MNKSINEIKKEVQEQDKLVEDLAFELFCRDQYRDLRVILKQAEEKLESIRKRDYELSLDELRKSYNGYNPEGNNRNMYIKVAKEKLKI